MLAAHHTQEDIMNEEHNQKNQRNQRAETLINWLYGFIKKK